MSRSPAVLLRAAPALTLLFTTVLWAQEKATNAVVVKSATAAAVTSMSIWPSTVIPTETIDLHTAVEVGEKFQVSEAGQIQGVRFYKDAANTGTHIGYLWSSKGQVLASVTFTNESASGWQLAKFAIAVNIQPDTTYIVSYSSPTGDLSIAANYLTSAYDSGPITLLSAAQSGGNGVYTTDVGSLPNQALDGANFWVDILFVAGTGSQPSPPPTNPPPTNPPPTNPPPTNPPPTNPPPTSPPPTNPPPCTSTYTYPNTSRQPTPPPPCPPPLPANPNPPGSTSQDDGPVHPCMEILDGVRLQSALITGYSGNHSLNGTLYFGPGCNINEFADQIYYGQEVPFYSGGMIYGFLHFWDEPATSGVWTIDNFTTQCIDYSKVPDCN